MTPAALSRPQPAGRTRDEFVRFVATGAFNAAITYGLYLVLLPGLGYRAAYTVSYVAGIGLAFVLTSRVVFRQRLALSKAWRFPAVYLVQYSVGLTALFVLVDGLGVDRRVAPLVALAASVPSAFLLSRRILKGTSRPAPPESLA